MTRWNGTRVRWAGGAVALAAWMAGCASGTTDSASDDTDTDTDTDTVAANRTVDHVALRRLNRSEYDRTVRDLLGTTRTPGRDFPVDDATAGFDVVGDGLVVSPLHLELYETAASVLVSDILDRPLESAVDWTFEAEDARFSSDAAYQDQEGGRFALYSGGAISGRVDIPATGPYRVSARVWGDQAGPDPVAVRLGVVGVDTEYFDITASTYNTAQTVSIVVDLREGSANLELLFDNDYLGDGGDRNAYVDLFKVQGPLDFRPEVHPAWDAVMVCDPENVVDPRQCVSEILDAFVPKAWRRPVEAAELRDLMALYDQVVENGDAPKWGLEFALRAVLMSPNFTMRIEPAGAATPTLVDDYTLASRLSYLIWSSMPDATLFDLASRGELNDPDVLAAQVHRMLADSKAEALADDLAGQWLMIRAVDDVAPDFWYYPSFTDDLRDSMKQSMRLQFMDFVARGAPLTELVDGKTVWVDDLLARHMGLGDVGAGATFIQKDVSNYPRFGWLTLPGLLTATSYPTRTSPVKRGVWVLSSLLCDEPPPPPADVPGFPEPDASASTVRERLAAHRTNPSCAACHDRMDPIGLSFEHFNGIGAWREVDQGETIDATGQLPDGTALDGVGSLADVLVDDPRFGHCLAEKTFTYALNRKPGTDDAPYIDDVDKALHAGGFTLESLLTAIVTSDPFRMQGTASSGGDE
ncbi:MAG: DUF1592 domain-containing protein [Alphaproteobacteria bacterium]|nr:DUF1592 domain-containing protein [Alphaproteobacteria bacterium]